MFRKASKIYWLGSVAQIRNYAPRKPGFRNNPEKTELESSAEYQECPDGLGDFESDFLNVHITHKQYEAEAELQKQKVRQWIVQRKYFKSQQPNLLTYAEKEQIKLLNSQDPEEWSLEKLAESFPADVATIKKILKANWVARTDKNIESHDRRVMENWELFKEGKLTNLSTELQEHLNKFVHRTPGNYVKCEEKLRTKLPVPTTTEFSDIITSCKKYSDDDRKILERPTTDLEQTIQYESVKKQSDDDTFIIDKIVNKKQVTLQELRQSMPTLDATSDECIQNKSTNSRSLEDMPGTFNIKKFDAKEITISSEDIKTYEITPIKERIYIPRKLWKRGATYKVEDCYYDDDGTFLYRVPGMTMKNT